MSVFIAVIEKGKLSPGGVKLIPHWWNLKLVSLHSQNHYDYLQELSISYILISPQGSSYKNPEDG